MLCCTPKSPGPTQWSEVIQCANDLCKQIQHKACVKIRIRRNQLLPRTHRLHDPWYCSKKCIDISGDAKLQLKMYRFMAKGSRGKHLQHKYCAQFLTKEDIKLANKIQLADSAKSLLSMVAKGFLLLRHPNELRDCDDKYAMKFMRVADKLKPTGTDITVDNRDIHSWLMHLSVLKTDEEINVMKQIRPPFPGDDHNAHERLRDPLTKRLSEWWDCEAEKIRLENPHLTKKEIFTKIAKRVNGAIVETMKQYSKR